MHDSQPILPGATLGVFGGGQLGRMFALAAARLGYRVHVFSPRPDSPTGQVADQMTVADYENVGAVAEFADSVDVVTLEFENVASSATEIAARHALMRPSDSVLHTTQNRLREKRFLADIGVPTAPFAEVTTNEQLLSAVTSIGIPAVLKTADSGYDGKGQAIVHTAEDADEAWANIGRQPAVLEKWINFQRELSVLIARSPTGEMALHGPIANDHVDHVLDVSMFPLAELEPLTAAAEEIGREIAVALDLVGICCVEFFLTDADKLLVNEIAPRTHNSGHLTIDATTTSQFEQQVRAVCGLPLGATDVVSPAAMVNLLGDLWESGQPPWEAVLAEPGVRLHLYGKTEARPGRKMGHLTVLADSTELAAERALAARQMLRTKSSSLLSS